jgi:hypothetical protein
VLRASAKNVAEVGPARRPLPAVTDGDHLDERGCLNPSPFLLAGRG